MFNLSICHHGDEATAAATILPGRWLRALILSALLWSGPLLADGAAIEPGHSGHWYDPQRSGEGWVLEVLDAERVLAYWFTYDEEGRQRWVMGMGAIVRDADGDRIHFDELYDTRGGRFGPDFDPVDVVRQVVVKRHPLSRIKATPTFTHPGRYWDQGREAPSVASKSLSR